MFHIGRYTQSRKLTDGKTQYYFSPPKDAQEADVVRPEVLGTHRERARLRAMHLNRKIDEWREAQEPTKVIIDGTVDALFDRYLKSRYFILGIGSNAQSEYRLWLSRVSGMEVEGGRFGTLPLEHVKHSHGDYLYDIVRQERGVVGAYRMVTVLRRVFNLGIRWDMLQVNPFTLLEVETPKARDAIWKPEDIQALRREAVALGRESISKAIQIAYDTALRKVDILKLQKKHLNVTTGMLRIEQSKTTREVNIPVSEDIQKLFLDLPNDDDYVITNEETNTKYNKRVFDKYFREICDAVGHADNLQFRDIRRTVLTELGDSGATEDELRAVSGHASRQVVSTYVRPTLQQARNAISKLRENRRRRE